MVLSNKEKKVFGKHLSDKGLVSAIYTELLKTMRRQEPGFLKSKECNSVVEHLTSVWSRGKRQLAKEVTYKEM